MTREKTRDMSARKRRFPIRRLSLRLDSPKKIVKTLWKHDPLLRLPIAGQLMLGFLLAALLAAFITGIIGVQRANALGRQAEFYQSLFRANTTLSMGTDLLKAINSQMDKNLLDAESVPTNEMQLNRDWQATQILAAHYTDLLANYTNHDLITNHLEQVEILTQAGLYVQIEEQRTYADGALRTWQIYQSVQNQQLQAIANGETQNARSITRLQEEISYNDALGALRSLVQFNGRLADSINQAAGVEAQQLASITLFGSLLAFFGIVVIGLLISRPLILRLKQLHQVTTAVGQGRNEARVEVLGKDEIAQVSGSVNFMLDQLVTSMQKTMLANTQLDEAYAQQLQVNQMKDQFILNVSHELRTPLTQVYGFLQLLQEHGERLNEAQKAEFVRQAIQGSEELMSLINTILDARDIKDIHKSVRREKVFLSPLVQGVYQQFEPHEKQGHTVSIEIADALSVWADAQHLRQVLRNLLTNAFKYTPQHTSIYISAASASETEETASSSSPIYLRIKDTGPGIPLEEQNLLFKKFVRLSRDISGNVRGIGLGLYICKQLVDEMGGHIWVESSGIAGEGCCFYVALPDASSTSPLEDHANRATRTIRQEIRHA